APKSPIPKVWFRRELQQASYLLESFPASPHSAHRTQERLPASLPSAKYRPDIDGLRAVAVLLGLHLHACPEAMPGGFVGVDVFFVISGFLITGIIARELEQGTFSLLTFYIRRVRRIFPALIVVLAVVLALGWFWMLPAAFAQLGTDVFASAG